MKFGNIVSALEEGLLWINLSYILEYLLAYNFFLVSYIFLENGSN